MKRFSPSKKNIRSLVDIVRPTLLVNEKRVRSNIQHMSRKARQSEVIFRPHFKTHQSAIIGEWFREEGVQKITVSSLTMAEYFVRHGWKDITVAFPVNIREKKLIQKLARQIRLNLLVESAETVNFLEEHIKTTVGLWLKVDVGYHRTGINWEDETHLISLSRQIMSCSHLQLEGILTHAGHSYQARGKSQLTEIYKESVIRLNHVKSILASAGISPLKISYGDTPTCSAIEKFEGVEEVRPGNFVFYDLMQLQIGSCTENEIACALACPVVAKHSNRQELLIYGGAVHLSKEYIMDERGQKIFGYLAPWDGKTWGPLIPDSWVSALSQEHGIIKANPDFFEQIKVGDLLALLPVHSCLAMDLMGEFILV